MGTTLGNLCSENDGNPLAVSLELEVNYFQTNPYYVYLFYIYIYTHFIDICIYRYKYWRVICHMFAWIYVNT